MLYDYVYADLSLQVTLDADGRSPFSQLNETESLILGRLLYQTLNTFQLTRALCLKDEDAIRKAKKAFT